jgi:hypothetical protein
MSEVGELLEEWDLNEPVGGYSPKVERSAGFVSCGPLFGPGVYALCRGDQIIYIGKAIKLIIRIYAHWNSMQRVKTGREAPKGTKGIIFTGVKVMACALSELDILEAQMIARHKPKYNMKLVPKGKVTLEQIGFDITRFGVAKVVETPVYRRRL